jgi:hypothetical protein
VLAERRLHRRQLRLHLDDDQDWRPYIDGKDVDRAALAELGIGDLRSDVEAEPREALGDGVDEPRVPGVDESIDHPPTPPDHEIEVRLECREDTLDRDERHTLERAPLQARDRLLAASGTDREVELPPAPASPQGPDDPAEADRLHGPDAAAGRVSGAYLALTRHSPAATRR